MLSRNSAGESIIDNYVGTQLTTNTPLFILAYQYEHTYILRVRKGTVNLNRLGTRVTFERASGLRMLTAKKLLKKERALEEENWRGGSGEGTHDATKSINRRRHWGYFGKYGQRYITFAVTYVQSQESTTARAAIL